MWSFFLVAFIIFISLCHPVNYNVFCCYGVRGPVEAMALQRNVVYQGDGRMNGWMTTETHKRGLKQELDTCLITVAFFFVSVSCKKEKDIHVSLRVCIQLYWWKGGLLRKYPADMKTVWYCFVTFYLYFEILSINPLLFSTFSSVKRLQICWYDTGPFLYGSKLYDEGGKTSLNEN